MYRFNLLSLPALFLGTAIAAPAQVQPLAPLNLAAKFGVEGEYFVRFKDGHTLADHVKAVKDVPCLTNSQIDEDLWKWGYNAKLSEAELVLVRADPGVHYVEQEFDGRFFDIGNTSNFSSSETTLEARDKAASVGYGLKYLSSLQKNPKDDAYYYLANSGAGVDIYILDTGVNINAAEFEGRASNFKDFSDDKSFDDKQDHGTSVAGTAGGRTYGAAKKPNLLSVKVNKGSKASGSRIKKGLQAIIDNHNSKKGNANFKGSVINMSFETTASSTLAGLLQTAFNAGIAMVAAAGNENVDAKDVFPCNAGQVTCVGSSAENYQKSSKSNYGQAVDYMVSGRKINSVDNTGRAPVQVSGTSFAAPYVTGILAIFFGNEGKSLTAREAMTRLDQNADMGYLTNLPSSNQINRMANSGYQKGQKKGKPYLDTY